MTSSRKFGRLLQAGCLGLIGMLAAAGCGGSSSPDKKPDGSTDVPGTSGEVGAPQIAILTVNPPSVNLGYVDVGAQSSPVTVTVTNQGTVASGPISVTVSGTGITATGCSGAPLAPKASCTLSVTAQVAVAGTISGTIDVGDSPTNTRKIAVSGIAMAPGDFTLLPAPLDLGNVLVGVKTTGTITMTNVSKPAQALSDIVIIVSGPGWTDAKTGTCKSTLEPNGTCTVVVNFTATASGASKGTLNVSQGGITKPVALLAVGQAPAKLVMTPPAASLTTVVGTPSSPVIFYVTNSGDVNTGIPSVAITGDNKDDFKFTSDCPSKALTGPATSSCQVTVTYDPKVAPTTNSKATLTVSEGGATGTSVSATLTGTAVPPSTLAITGTPTDLGTVTVGTTGAATTFTVTNNGGENSGALEISAAPGQFIIGANTCADKDLAPKATCTFTAQFKPATGDAGVIIGQLKAKGAATDNPAILGVTGNAVPAAKLSIAPVILEFGALPTMQESAPLTLTVSNVGGVPTGQLKVENTGPQFKVIGDTCKDQVLTAPGTATSSCLITVTFTASTVHADATGSVVVANGADTVSASLHGTGLEHAGLTMTPSVICPQFTQDDKLCFASGATAPVIVDGGVTHYSNPVGASFKNKVVGQTTAELPITLWNLTAPTLAPDSGDMTFTITGDAKGDFKIVQNNCTKLLSTTQGTSCLLTLTFTPSAVGLRKATLVLSTTRGGASQTTLEGKGLAPIELQPLQVSKSNPGTDFGQESLGHSNEKKILPYRVWLRSTTSTENTTTVTVTLPPATPADFVWPNLTGTPSMNLTIGGTDDLLSPPVVTTGTGCATGASCGIANDGNPFLQTTNTVTAGVNPCHNKVISLALGATGVPSDEIKKNNSDQHYYFDNSSGYFYCDFAVQFYPNSARGDLTADLTATGTSVGTSKVNLTGKAVGPLSISPSPYILPDPVAVGLSSTTNLTLTVTNNGGVKQSGLTFALSGTGAEDFQIVGTTCWTKTPGPVVHALPTGLPYPAVIDELGTSSTDNTCLVWVGFQPTKEAGYNVTLTVTAANGDGAADDETATVSLQTVGSKTFGALTITPDPATLADTAYNVKNAAPIVLTLKNNGSLDTGVASISVKGGAGPESSWVANQQFEIVSQLGVAGACNSSTVWHVPGNASCTISLRALPTSVLPADVRKKLITGKLTVSATPGGVVNVPLSYYETSNLVIVEGTENKAQTSFTYAAKGQNTKDSHTFTVKNLGADAVTLKLTPPTNDTFTIDSTTECKDGFLLGPGLTCSLIVTDLHKSTTPVGVKAGEEQILYVQDNAHQTENQARIFLSSVTLNPSNLVAFGGPGTAPDFVGSGTPVYLGQVPYGAQSGVAKFWFKNTGDVDTDTLTYKWDSVTANNADSEFKMVAPANEQEMDCQNFFSKKPLGPQQMCYLQIYFKPLITTGTAGPQLRNLTVLNGNRSVNPVLYLTATRQTETGNVYVTQDPAATTNVAGFYQFTTAATTTTKSESRKFWVINNQAASASDITLTLPSTTAQPWQRVSAGSTPPADECGTTLASQKRCQFTLVYAPSASPGAGVAFEPGSLSVVGSPSTVIGLVGQFTLASTLTVVPPIDLPLMTTPVAGLDMLSVAVDVTSDPRTLTIVNTGNTQTTPLTAALTPATGSTAFATFAIAGGTCEGTNLSAYGTVDPSTKAPMDRCTIRITARGVGATTTRVYSTLKVKGLGGIDGVTPATEVPYNVGIAVQNKATLSFATGTTGSFGSAAVTGYSQRTFTISNGSGDYATSGIIEAKVEGASKSQFQMVGNTCPPNIGLLHDASCEVTVRFMPTALTTGGNAVVAALVVTANPGTPISTEAESNGLRLQINGMPKSSLTISPTDNTTPSPLTYTIPDSTTATKTFVITNEGTADTTEPITTSITNKAEFMLVNDECYGVELAQGENCIITVKYIGPASSTAKKATLTVNGGSAGQTVSIDLSYTGQKASAH